MQLSWMKCAGDVWCPLNTFDVTAVTNKIGVYFIWHQGDSSRVVRVGSGNIRNRLTEHRSDEETRAYEHLGLVVTWAEVPNSQAPGVEWYLGNWHKPLVGERFPDATPITVNDP